MARPQLEEAAELLRQAAETADDDVRERLNEQADRFDDAATREHGPDHGWLDRHTHVVRELGDDLDEDGSERVEKAVERINDYRSGVSGV